VKGEATCEGRSVITTRCARGWSREAGGAGVADRLAIEEIRRKVGALPGGDGRTWWQKLYGQ